MNEQENKAKSVPLLIYENEMKHKKHIIVGLFTILGILLLVLGIAIYMFMSMIFMVTHKMEKVLIMLILVNKVM